MTASAISHLMKEPDWFALKIQPPMECAENIQAILKALEGHERFIYAVRGEALRIFDERELYRLYTDPATSQPCSCCFRYLQVYMPDSARYCQEALVNRQRLCNAIPLEQAAKMTRANLRLLEGASESVQRLPEIQKAAETMTERQFAQTLSRDHHQHIEPEVTLRFRYPAGDAETVSKALAIVGEKIGVSDPAGQLLSWAIDFIAENVEVSA